MVTLTAVNSCQNDANKVLLWTEIPLDKNSGDNGGGCTKQQLGERIQNGHSLIVIPPCSDNPIITANECEKLIADCTNFAATSEPTDFETVGRRRLPTQRAVNAVAAAAAAAAAQYCNNTPCGDALPDHIEAVVEDILQRTTQFIDQHLSMLVPVLFDATTTKTTPKKSSLTEYLIEEQLKFASREPAINIYTKGGEFAAHQDDESLTVLIPLSSSPEDYEGGGTAYWSKTDAKRNRSNRRNSNDNSNNNDDGDMPAPTLVLKPPAGTVILFGGCVTHAGRPVLEGKRVVLVASFSLQTEEDEMPW